MLILLVEDEILVALDVKDTLASLGYPNVQMAEDLDTAERLLARTTPDFALLDVNLGSTLVFPFAAELRARGIPFVFQTASAPETFPPEWRGWTVLDKPVRLSALAAALMELTVDEAEPEPARARPQPTDHAYQAAP
jgi:DNA-binding response OmpR family regulator